ncbi:MAG: lycopene cyclase domain-containing protein [Actinomycetia bacterium]|nr:lycopene cyclase domain-containing protein [Actinomycetes bacterium]
MERWQYMLVLGACLAITAPLEFFGAGVYRRPRRTLCAILPVAAIFLVWDLLAIAGDVWTFDPRYLTGIELPLNMPLEEALFFIVIPLCGLLTYNAVSTILERAHRQIRPRTDTQ